MSLILMYSARETQVIADVRDDVGPFPPWDFHWQAYVPRTCCGKPEEKFELVAEAPQVRSEVNNFEK